MSDNLETAQGQRDESPFGVDTSMRAFREKLRNAQEAGEQPSLDAVAAEIGNIAYRAAGVFEDLEHTPSGEEGFKSGLYRGNGHHAAQYVVGYFQLRLAQGWYDREEAEAFVSSRPWLEQY